VVEYLSCEYLNSKHFKHIFIRKISIIHIHLLYFTSKIFKLFKNATYNVQLAVFSSFYFTLQIRFQKFSGLNSTVNSKLTSRNCRKSSRLPSTISICCWSACCWQRPEQQLGQAKLAPYWEIMPTYMCCIRL